MWASTPYAVAFSGLERADAGTIMEAERGDIYGLRNSGTILVPSSRFAMSG
jgi:hypothetical protein